MYHGDIRLGDTLDVKFTTRRFTTGAPFTLAGTPAVAAYVGNNTTELTAGITLSVDFDSRTGLNNVRVVATSGNGYATASNYQLVITAGTVDSVSVVGEVVATFSIEARSALMPTTAGRTLVVDAAGLADANVVKVGPTGAGTAQTAGDIMADTNDIQTRLPAALVGGRMDSSVGALAANVITAASIATNAIDADALATDAVTEIQAGLATSASVDDLPTNAELAAALATADDAMLAQIALVKAKTDNLPTDPADASDIAASFVTLGTAVADIPTNAEFAAGLAAADDATLAAIAALSTAVGDIPTNAEIATALDAVPTAAENADAVWDEALAGHVIPGSTGEALADAGSVTTAPTAAENADALLGRNLAGGSNGGRMVKDALRSLRNKTSITSGTLTVCAEDDTTTAWTAIVTTTPGDPLSAIDPA